MSVELKMNSSDGDGGVAGEVASAVSAVLRAEGKTHEQAYGAGRRGAQMAVEIVLHLLRKKGSLLGDPDPEAISEAVWQLLQDSGVQHPTVVDTMGPDDLAWLKDV